MDSTSESTDRSGVARRVAYRTAACLLLLAGFATFLFLEWYGTRHWRWGAEARRRQMWTVGIAVLITAGVALALPITEPDTGAARTLERIRRPSRRARFFVALLLGLASAGYLYFTAVRQGHRLDVRIHDENMYVVQAQMLAKGRLWMPEHPQADFFESYHVFVRPVYAGMYFPGTALLYAIPIRLGLPTWAFSVGLGGFAVAMVYLLMTELIDGLAGIAGAVMMLANRWLRYFGVMVMSHPLSMALGLVMFWSALRWRESGRRRWLVLMGVCGGWSLITRPLDALCFVVPIGLFMLWELRKHSWACRVRAAGLIVLAGVPFLSLQLIMNRGVSGHLLKTPVQAYLESHWPEMQLGGREPLAFRYKPVGLPRAFLFAQAARPVRWCQHQALRAALPPYVAGRPDQFQDFYVDFVLPAVRNHRATEFGQLLGDRVRVAMLAVLPGTILAIVLPVAVLGFWDARRLVFVAPALLFVAAYLSFPFFLRHYVLVIAPMLVFMALLGLDCLRRSAGSAAPLVQIFSFAVVVGISLRALPEFNRGAVDQPDAVPMLADVNERLAALPAGERAVVLFRYHPEEAESWKEEPVYTLDAAWPDDARIVRAHDLGERNAELIGYYARVQPDRVFYSYDCQSRELARLGVARELARR
jgi:hypothetical protein